MAAQVLREPPRVRLYLGVLVEPLEVTQHLLSIAILSILHLLYQGSELLHHVLALVCGQVERLIQIAGQLHVDEAESGPIREASTSTSTAYKGYDLIQMPSRDGRPHGEVADVISEPPTLRGENEVEAEEVVGVCERDLWEGITTVTSRRDEIESDPIDRASTPASVKLIT